MERKTNKEQFYQASLRLFFEKGYKATSMRNIADKLDITGTYSLQLRQNPSMTSSKPSSLILQTDFTKG